jgi:hypothetical protein
MVVPDMQEITPILQRAGCERDRRTIDGRKTVIWVGVTVPVYYTNTAPDQGKQ